MKLRLSAVPKVMVILLEKRYNWVLTQHVWLLRVSEHDPTMVTLYLFITGLKPPSDGHL